MISHTVLLACGSFPGGLDSERVGSALAHGLCAARADLEPEVCPVPPPRRGPTETQAWLSENGFEQRMRGARAIVLAERSLGLALRPVSRPRRAARGGVPFEIATRARQGGVPLYAVIPLSGEGGDGAQLDLFAARMLDLQVVLEARDERALRAAGRKLAGLL